MPPAHLYRAGFLGAFCIHTVGVVLGLVPGREVLQAFCHCCLLPACCLLLRHLVPVLPRHLWVLHRAHRLPPCWTDFYGSAILVPAMPGWDTFIPPAAQITCYLDLCHSCLSCHLSHCASAIFASHLRHYLPYTTWNARCRRCGGAARVGCRCHAVGEFLRFLNAPLEHSCTPSCCCLLALL